ncbi:hypothetical protein BH11GEM1_BH11GEM1_24940 [soil metagenome]
MTHVALAHFATRLRLLAPPAVAGFATLFLGAWRPAGAQTAAPPPEGGRGPHVVTVVTRDFAFEMPDAIPAGVTTFRLRNAGRQPHHLMLYRLEPGRRLADVLAALRAGGAHPRWMHAAGGPNAVVGGRESVGTLRLAPGRYVAFCHVKSPDKVLHFAKGMWKLITVTPELGSPLRPAAAPGTALPAADLTVTLSDYAFRFSRSPTRGRHRIAVTNRGGQPHEFILSKLAPGKTSADFVHWMDTQEGAPPVQPYGGATDLPPGGTIVLDIDLEPGRYSAVCRVRDAVDGQPHDRHGMTAGFVVP